MNLSKELKKKRDAEDRLRQTSPQKIFFPEGFIDLSQFANKNHSHKFIDLTDTPSNYVADKFVKVNADGTALEYGDGGGGGIDEIPQATETTLGGIKAVERTTGETQEVKIDTATGKLYSTPPSSATNGLPSGGTAGQILSKIDGDDYNAQWINSLNSYVNPIDKPPTTPSAWDDEFNGISIDSKWIRIIGTNGTMNVSDGNLIALFTATSGDKGNAILQTAPTGDFSITLSIKEDYSMANYTDNGIVLAQSLTDTSPTIIFGFGYDAGHKIRAIRWNGFLATWNANYVGASNSSTSGYFKITKVGTTLTFYFSLTGRIWRSLATVTAPFTIGAIGIGVGANSQNVDTAFDWFRVEQL